MPIMATHNQNADSSPNGNVFYDNTINDSPESPTSRKRKQEELQYSSHNVIHHLELPTYYSSNQNDQQQWHQHPPQPPQPPQVQAATSDASSLVIGFNNEATMQTSSDISPWNHHHNQIPQHSISSLMQPDFNISDPQQTSAYTNSNPYLQPQHSEQSSSGLIHGGRHDVLNSTGGGNGGVGENKGLSEIHQMLNLDQFATTHTATSTSVQTPTPSNYNFVDEPSSLHLTDLSTGNLHQQRQLIQSWSNDNGGTTNAQQNNYSNNGNSTPGFFTPGFLESLQEDDNESYHTPGFPFHHHNQSRDWHTSSSSSPPGNMKNSMEHDTIMVNNKIAFISFVHALNIHK